MSISTQLEVDAEQLLTDFGYDVTHRRVTGQDSSGYDPATGTVGTTANDDETVRGVFLQYRTNDPDFSFVERGDRKLVLSGAVSKVPREGDRVLGEGDEVEIIAVRTIKAGANVIAYVCQVRE